MRKDLTAAASWQFAFPQSKANRNSARITAGSLLRWYRHNYPKEFAAVLAELRGLREPRKIPLRPWWRRSTSDRRATMVIGLFCVVRLPLERCWRTAAPTSKANPNSARILATRTANVFIRKRPRVVPQVIREFERRWVEAHRLTRNSAGTASPTLRGPRGESPEK